MLLCHDCVAKCNIAILSPGVIVNSDIHVGVGFDTSYLQNDLNDWVP